MPRKSPRTSTRNQQRTGTRNSTAVAPAAEECSADETTSSPGRNVRRSTRKGRETSAKKPVASTDNRVFRRSTRVSSSKPVEVPKEESNNSDIASVDEEMPKRSKRKAPTTNTRSPAKRRAVKAPAKKVKRRSTVNKKKKPIRRRKKQESEEESEESELSLGESEEEEKVEDAEDDEEDEVRSSAAPVKSPSRSERAARRSVRRISGQGVLPSNSKSSPSVLLERMDRIVTGRSLRKRPPVKSLVKSAVATVPRGKRRRKEGEAGEEEEEEEDASDKEEAQSCHEDLNDENVKTQTTEDVESKTETDGNRTTPVSPEKSSVVPDGDVSLKECGDERPAKKPREDESTTEENKPIEVDLESESSEVKDAVSGVTLPVVNDKPVTDASSESKSDLPKNQTIVNRNLENNVATSDVVSDKVHDENCTPEIMSASLGVKVLRNRVDNPDLTSCTSSGGFSLVSYNLADVAWESKHQRLLEEVTVLAPSILCLQNVDEGYFKSLLDSSLKSLGYMGLFKNGKSACSGLAMFYLLSSFEILNHVEFEASELLAKDIESTAISDVERESVKDMLQYKAPVLITKLKGVTSGKYLAVANVSLPYEIQDAPLALQASAILREMLSMADGSETPHVVCGGLNLLEGSAALHLLRFGCVEQKTLDEIKKKSEEKISNGQNVPLVSLLEKTFSHRSPSLKSSYASILGHELSGKNAGIHKDSVWFSSDKLIAKSVLDVSGITTTEVPVHLSLKVDLGFKD